jgi:hypothetical protein
MKALSHRLFRRPVLGVLLTLMGLANIPLLAQTPGPDLKLTVLYPENASQWNATDTFAVRVALRHPGLSSDTVSDDPLILAPAGRAWPAAVSLRVIAQDGREQSWPLIPSGTTRVEPYQLNLGSNPFMSFVLDADPSRRIPAGAYSLVAILDIQDGTGWTGRSESAPLAVVVADPPDPGPGIMLLSVKGDAVLAVGDPWVVSLHLLPPLETTAETALRSGYHFRVFDASDREMPWAFEPATTLPTLPDWRDLLESGLKPVLAVLPPTAANGQAPGSYRIEATWDGGALGTGRTASMTVTVNPLASVQGHPDRETAMLQQELGWAMSLLWRAEFSSTADIERLTRQAAPLLVTAEKRALEWFLNHPDTSLAALTLSETFFLGGDFDGAMAFRSVAEGLRTPSLSFLELAPDPFLDELAQFRSSIEEAAAGGPGRILPYLRPAIAAARPPDFSTQWATTARASSEYRSSDYGAAQATGAPNVTRHGDNARAWASKTADAGEEWLELGFAEPVPAQGLRIIQSFNPGAVVRIDLLSETATSTTVWTGPDQTVYPKGEIGLLEVSFPPTPQPVKGAKIWLDTKTVAGWNEIDAVQLLAAKTPPAPPRLLYHLASTDPQILEFPTWPAGYVLQRATRLSPSDWTNHASESPAQFQMTGEAAYFRLRRAP